MNRKAESQNYKSEDFSKTSLADRLFTNCMFQSCNFTESAFWNAEFCSCIFNCCNLTLVKMEGCRLQDVRFEECKIVGAEFFKCQKIFFTPQFIKCLLQHCNFSDLNLKEAIFSGSKLQGCYFTNTSLIGANFVDADLTGTLFHNSNLSKADFSSSVNYDIDPRTNQIKKAKFSLPEAVGLLRAFEINIV